jgi:hypothetical protein
VMKMFSRYTSPYATRAKQPENLRDADPRSGRECHVTRVSLLIPTAHAWGCSMCRERTSTAGAAAVIVQASRRSSVRSRREDRPR